MTRRREAQLTIAQIILFGVVLPRPEELMDAVLRRIDTLLEDDALVDRVLEVLRGRFGQSATRGRRGTPAEVVLRMLVLKHLRRWSYDALEREVTGSLVYRRFCRIDGGKVPDAKTMVRLGQLLAGPVLRQLFDRVVAVAVEKRVTKGRKMRMDTTVVEAAIRYPTDSGLCEAAIRVLGRALRRLAAAGVRLPFVLRNASRSVARRMKEIGQALRTRGKCAKKKALEKPYRRLLRVTGRVVRQAERATEAARKQMARFDRTARRVVERLVAHIEKMAPRARQVVRQTRARIVRGVTNSSGKLLSLFETKAQIHRRGKLRRPTEFGALVLVQEAEGGIVTDIGVVAGKADAPLLVPAVQRHVEVFGRAPDVVAVDRGFYSSDGERRIQELGVRHAVVPKPGGRSRVRLLHERQRWFRRGRAWRAGSEGRISRLKNGLGMARSRYRGDDGTDRTAYWAGIANNLLAIAARSA